MTTLTKTHFVGLCLALSMFLGCLTPFGVYHKVQDGETLYRISVTYGVPIDRLAEVNRIDSPEKIFPGELIFVPGANEPRTVAKYQPPTKPKQKVAQPAKTANRKTKEVTKLRTTREKPNGNAQFIWPVQGDITSKFGQRNGVPHDGLDIGAPKGTPILAAAAGRVIYSDDGLQGYGNLIIVRHEGELATVYAHNRKNLVGKGAFVQQGQRIAEVGRTGRASAPHLHFEIRKGKVPQDPLKYLTTR